VDGALKEVYVRFRSFSGPQAQLAFWVRVSFAIEPSYDAKQGRESGEAVSDQILRNSTPAADDVAQRSAPSAEARQNDSRRPPIASPSPRLTNRDHQPQVPVHKPGAE
jgi:hypothetical protein